MAKQKQRIDENLGTLGAGGGGSNDVTSGGGAGAGIPDAEMADRAPEVLQGDVKKDKEKLFPEHKGSKKGK